MEDRLVFILNEMAEYLSVAQMKKLQEVLLKNLAPDYTGCSTPPVSLLNSSGRGDRSGAEYAELVVE